MLALVVWLWKNWRADHHPNPDPGFELAYPNIYSICEFLKCMKGLALEIQSCKISMTQGNNRISERSPGEEPVLMV